MGNHVDEGVIEWPPLPWRPLRALVATWKTRYPDLTDDQVVRVLAILAAPPAVRADPRIESSIHTYLLAEGHRHGAAKPDTDLMVDAFAAIEPGNGVAYRWPASLDDREREILDLLVTGLPYLGRAESVCEAAVCFPYDHDYAGWIEPSPDTSGRG